MTRTIQIFIITILTILAYTNIFWNGFVIDDQYFIKDRNTDPPSQLGVFRPIRSLLYSFYFQIWGTENPTGYHFHSLAVHLLSAILVYLICTKVFPKAALTTGVLFTLHPIHTESITYIAASMEMVGVLFMLLSFYLYLKSRNISSYLFASLAFFTYEMTLTLPLILILYEWQLGNHNWKKVMPIGILMGTYLFVRIGVFHISPARGDYLAYSFYHTQLTMIQMWVKYIWMLIWPMSLSHNQTILPGFEAFMTPYSDLRVVLNQTIFDPLILGAMSVIGGIWIVGWKLRHKIPIISFAIGWLFLSLLPVAYFFPQGTAFAEKYLYISSVGFVLLVGYWLSRLGKIGVIATIAISLFYGFRTYLRNYDWQTPKSLWEYESRIHPRSELAYYNLGIIYNKNGDKDKAIKAYQKVLEIKPDFWQAKNNLENLLK